MTITNRATCVAALCDDFAAAFPTLPTVFRNQPFAAVPKTDWAAVHVLWGNERQLEMGDHPLYRAAGVLVVNYHAAFNTGETATATFADALLAHYRGRLVAGVRFRSLNGPTHDERGAWSLTTFQFPFYADSVG